MRTSISILIFGKRIFIIILIHTLYFFHERNPVIVFSFSKKDCEKYALELNREDYTDDIEKDLISQVYANAIESLGEDDRKLPQVEALLPLLKKGIGIHHGGLLPILKEIVEILFSEGLIKALFATETFVSLFFEEIPNNIFFLSPFRIRATFSLQYRLLESTCLQKRLSLPILESGTVKTLDGYPRANTSKCPVELVVEARTIAELSSK